MYWLLVLLVYCGFTFGVEKDDCSKPNKLKIYQDYGNVTITGNDGLLIFFDFNIFKVTYFRKN